MKIIRLDPAQAPAIVACFRRVYGESYANALFYDAGALADAMRDHRVGCVGALADDGTVIGHMAMTVDPIASVVELGNTVVDPAARGEGLAWKVGAELSAWSRELGYQGFLHYPTTDHHIMQRQSVKEGFETGLMLGYIPAETDGKVVDNATLQRQATTVVYQPFSTGAAESLFLPEYCSERVRGFAAAVDLERRWRAAGSTARVGSRVAIDSFGKRGLARLSITRTGVDVTKQITEFDTRDEPCRQIDFSMADSAIDAGVDAALAAGYWFCGWLPGYRATDVFRMQKVDRAATDMSPGLVNPVARSLLALVP